MKRWLQKMINGPVWRRAVVWAGTIAGGVLLGRVDLLGGIMPFGGAWVMAAGMAGLPVTGAILGVLVGTLTLGVSLTHLTVLLPAALVFFAMLVARRTQWQPGVGMGILLLTAARLSLLPFSAFLIYDLVRFAIESLLAAGSCYVLCHAAQAAQQRFHMKEGRQRLCVTVAAAMLLCGLTDAEVFGFFPQYFLAAGLTLWAAWVGGGALGAACGLGVGMVLSLGGVDVSVAAALGAGGLLCGVFRPAGRVFCALGLLLGDVVMTAWTTLFAVPALPLLETAAAALTLVVVPTRPAKQFAQSILPSQQERERQRELKLDKLRSETVERIDCFAQCLEELSGVFSEAVVSEAGTMEDVAPLLEAVADEACGDCPLFERCWEKEFYVTYQCFVRTLTAPGKRRIILEEDFPPRVSPQMPAL